MNLSKINIDENRFFKPLVASILTKPFVILTGGSGSGKTQLAKYLANYFSLCVQGGHNVPFRVGDIVGQGNSKYTITKISNESITIKNPRGSLIVFPKQIVDEWIQAVESGKIHEGMSSRGQRDAVKEGSIFDPFYHGWTAQLAGLGYAGAKQKGDGENILEQGSSEATVSSAIVPVGADWTDNRNVLGFVNHLQEKNGKPVYQTTPILDLILEANVNTLLPHFLILDEMNLSHVERYFADFLSVMEQKDGGIWLHSEGGALPKNGEGEGVVPEWIPFPQNLFVIGTVNVDETTYMFSPKVLDRANVIEFTVENKEIQTFLENPHEYPEAEKAADGVAEAFLQLALDARAGRLDPLDGIAATKVPEHLVALFDILKRGRFEFAYRTANEVVRYLRVCRHLAHDKAAWDSEGWKSDLDAQIIQKLLPKLHGSIGRIARLLAELAVHCHLGENPPEDEKDNGTSPGLTDAIELDEEIAAFPKSFKKLKSMMETLRDEQFVSFIQ
jgi:hypothetical protein